MEAAVRNALATDRTIDITTTGRRSGKPRRVEMWFHNVDGRIFITGMPGKRDWYANVLANPVMTFHLKQSVAADLSATAHPVVVPGEKRRILEVILDRISDPSYIDKWMARSPLIEVVFD
jgi:deazaflavin-dependent oxidoreductase (nitroreductase family)